MGLRVRDFPDDYGAGADCLACYDAGKTPNYVFVTFWSISTCSGFPSVPNGKTFVCLQVPTDPCRWIGYLKHLGRDWRAVYWSNTPDNGGFFSGCSLVPWDPPGTVAFYGIDVPCFIEFSNSLTCVGGYGGEGGYCIIDDTPDILAYLLTHEYHFVTIPGVFYERQDVGMDHAVYRIAHTQDKTNVMVLLDLEDVVYE